MSPVALLRSQLLQSLALQWFWRWRLIFYVFCCKTLTNHLIQSLGSRTKCWVICPAVVFASPVWVCRSMSPEILKLKIDENRLRESSHHRTTLLNQHSVPTVHQKTLCTVHSYAQLQSEQSASPHTPRTGLSMRFTRVTSCSSESYVHMARRCCILVMSFKICKIQLVDAHFSYN